MARGSGASGLRSLSRALRGWLGSGRRRGDTRPVVVVGDSHAIALREGLETLRAAEGGDEGEGRDIFVGQLDHGYKFLQRFFHRGGDRLEFSDPRAWELFRAIVSPTEPWILRRDRRHFVFCFGFHPSGSMMATHWREHVSLPALAAEKHYVSDSAFRALVRDYNGEILRFFAALQDLDVSFSVVTSPPLSRLSISGWRTEFYRDEEIWAYHKRFGAAFAAELDRRGVRHHRAPARVLTEDGFLRPEFSSTRRVADYHANARYGAIMLEHVLEELRREPA